MKAIIHKVSIDNEGESTITFRVPYQEIAHLTHYLNHISEVIELEAKFTNTPEYEYQGLHEL